MPSAIIWLQTIGNWQVRLTSPQYGPQIQSVYWFISLLFAFFVLFTLGVYAQSRGRFADGKPLTFTDKECIGDPDEELAIQMTTDTLATFRAPEMDPADFDLADSCFLS